MVELQGVRTPIVPAHLTPTTPGGERLSTQLASAALDGLDQVLASIGIRPTIRHPFTPFLQPLALPVELPGNEVGPFYPISRRPSIAFDSVTSSAYSRSPPTGSPRAMRVIRMPSGLSRRAR